MDWNSVFICGGTMLLWAFGAYGSYRALTDLLEDDVVAMVFGAVWPLTWPLIGVFGIIWRGDSED